MIIDRRWQGINRSNISAFDAAFQQRFSKLRRMSEHIAHCAFKELMVSFLGAESYAIMHAVAGRVHGGVQRIVPEYIVESGTIDA